MRRGGGSSSSGSSGSSSGNNGNCCSCTRFETASDSHKDCVVCPTISGSGPCIFRALV